MKLLRNILLVGLMLAGWTAGSYACLSRVAYYPEAENTASSYYGPAGEAGFRKAVMEASRNIEPGFQTHTQGNVCPAGAKRTAGGNSNRVPVAAVQFTKSPHGKIPVVLQTYKSVFFAAFRSRDFYVIGLRHLII